MNEPLPQSSVCSRCGTSIQSTANFCHVCGATVEKSLKSRPKNRPLLGTLILLIVIGLTTYAMYRDLHKEPHQSAQQTSDTKPSAATTLPAESPRSLITSSSTPRSDYVRVGETGVLRAGNLP